MSARDKFAVSYLAAFCVVLMAWAAGALGLLRPDEAVLLGFLAGVAMFAAVRTMLIAR